MSYLFKLFLAVAALTTGAWTGFVQARVFNFADESVAAYFRGTGGLSAVSDNSFADSSGSGTSFSDETKYNFSAELGTLIHLSEKVNLRLGLELLQAKPLEGIKGKNSGGTDLFSLTSEVFAVNPIATLEINHHRSATFRLFFYGGGGWADVTLDNAYVMTADGEAEGWSDFTEKTSGKVASWHLGYGMETLFTDNVTFQMDLGYRYLPVNQLEFKEGVTTIAQGTVSKGDRVKNNDGSDRSIDFSGFYIGMSFRFYIDVPH